MRNTFLLSILILLLAGCNKDKFNTQPLLKYESVNTTILGRGENLVFNLSFTDAEGDLSDTLIIVKFEPNCANSRFNAKYKLPLFPLGKNQSGDLVVTFGRNIVISKSYHQIATLILPKGNSG